MVVIYTSLDDKEAAEKLGEFLGQRVIRTEEFILDKITDKKVVLVGGEAVNPNVKYLVDNKYIPSISDIKDFVGYEPCCIRYCKYNDKDIWIVAGWEKEHTDWTVDVIIYEGSLPVQRFFTLYNPDLISEFSGKVIYPVAVHFKLYNIPFVIEATLKEPVDSEKAREIAYNLENYLREKFKFIVYRAVLYEVEPGKYGKIFVSGESEYETVLEYYQRISEEKLIAIPAYVWIALAVFAIGAGVYFLAQPIVKMVMKYFDLKEEEIRYKEMKAWLDYCDRHNIPPEECLDAWKYTLEKMKEIEEERAKKKGILETIKDILALGLGIVMLAIFYQLLSMFRRK